LALGVERIGLIARSKQTEIRNMLRSDTPQHLCAGRSIPFIELPELLFVFPNRDERFGLSISSIVAGRCRWLSRDFRGIL
jgi:hypothetical protein